MNGFRFRILTGAIAIAVAFFATCPVRAQTQEIQDKIDSELLFARLLTGTNELLGASFQPVGEALRAQLDIPAGQGLLVESVVNNGPSAVAGLKANDILLMLADKPLASTEDLTKNLKAAGEAPVPLKILRAGKPITIQVRPIYRVTLGAVEVRKTEFFIGVSLDNVDDAMRAQLGLAANQGVVISEVVAGSPAEKAGVKKFDVVIEMGDKAIDNSDTLAAQVQANKDKPTSLRILRGSKQVIVAVTPAIRNVEADASANDAAKYLALVQDRININSDGWQLNQLQSYARFKSRARIEEFAQRMEQVEKELQALRRIEALENQIKALNENIEKLKEAVKSGKK